MHNHEIYRRQPCASDGKIRRGGSNSCLTSNVDDHPRLRTPYHAYQRLSTTCPFTYILPQSTTPHPIPHSSTLTPHLPRSSQPHHPLHKHAPPSPLPIRLSPPQSPPPHARPPAHPAPPLPPPGRIALHADSRLARAVRQATGGGVHPAGQRVYLLLPLSIHLTNPAASLLASVFHASSCREPCPVLAVL